ncbi:ArsR family transcriptional regulator [Rhizobium sp. PP-F2F-G38]|nr:ArsR family transcriptional regulator [Rhizobium sp. PP-WC-1G-195]PYE92546.1 ArsR family transcriptional regulator [Rhizobium sp. PP-F2F-G38]TCP79114.1 DNA-binding transcriptional ArsR family regulator [Rhizobium sp. PP-CC-2G-626]
MNSDRRERTSCPCIFEDDPFMTDRLFNAISDSRRRYLLEQLMVSPMTVKQMSDRLPISRPRVSQHLKVLRDAQLVLVQTCGTRRVHMINNAAFQPLQTWIDNFRAPSIRERTLI